MPCPTIAIPLPIREREAIVERATAVAHLRRRKEAIDHDERLSVPQALVFQLPPELAHRSIAKRLGQLGSRKALDVQVLDADRVIPTHEAGRELVDEVVSLACGLLVGTGQFLAGLIPSLRSQFAAGDSLLGTANLLRRLAIKLRRLGRLVGRVRGDDEVGQSEVDADDLRGMGRRDGNIRHLELDRQADVPMPVGLPGERGALGRPVHFLGLPDTDPTNLGDVDFAVRDLDPLGDAESSTVPLATLEPRIAGSTLEEIHEGSMQVFEDLLEGLGIALGKPRRFGLGLQFGQLGRELGQRYRLTGGRIGLFPPGKCPVPDEPASARHPVQGLPLILLGSHPESIDLAMLGHVLISRRLFGDVSLDGIGRHVACCATEE